MMSKMQYPNPKEQIEQNEDKLVTIDVSPIFADCIRKYHFGESISIFFDPLAAID